MFHVPFRGRPDGCGPEEVSVPLSTVEGCPTEVHVQADLADVHLGSEELCALLHLMHGSGS